ncbi:hypothetical protein, partial [Burkholderia cenocepacia]|uniref:hypothetical protein n=1 Tax=Burkholderia cenocepacia TaxID=95486 RepID=UPI001C89461F
MRHGRHSFDKTSFREETAGRRTGRFTLLHHRIRMRPGSSKVEAVEVHHLVPGGDEVAHELLLRIRA